MFLRYWQLDTDPFTHSIERANLYWTASRKEAILRCEFAVENSTGPTLFSGLQGTGKSFLLRYLKNRLIERGLIVYQIDCHQLTGDSILDEIARTLELDNLSESRNLIPQIQDSIEFADHDSTKRVMILDHLETVGQGGWQVIEKISQLESQYPQKFSLLLSMASEGIGIDPPRCTYGSIRIEIEPFSTEETFDFLYRMMVSVGGNRPLFTPAACELICESASGKPGLITRLARISLLAGANANAHEIDDEIVMSAIQELVLSPSHRAF